VRAITAQQAADALQEQFGSDYRVTAHGSGAAGPGREATTFHVHGGGLIIGRIVNELGIARPVTAAVKQTFGPGHAA